LRKPRYSSSLAVTGYNSCKQNDWRLNLTSKISQDLPKISSLVRSAIQAYFGQREHFVQAGAILDSKEAPGERGRKNQHEGEYKYLL